MTRLRSRLARPVVGLAAATAAIAGVTAVANPQSASAAGTPVSSTAASAGQPPASLAVDQDGNTVLGAASTVQPASVTGQYIVQVEDPASLTDVVADVTADGVAITNTIDGAIVGFTAPLDSASAAELREVDGVVSVERDRQMELSEVQNGATWGLDRIDQRQLPLDSRYSASETGAGVDAYVIDSGIRPTHVDFAGRVKLGAYIDFGDGRNVRDCNGHGTHVSGTIGGSTWGVAKGVSIIPVKVFPCSGGIPTSYIVNGINWVIEKHAAGSPAVVNMSLGGPASTVLDDAVRALISDGVTVVVAAGNEGAPTCNYSPARVAGAITVAASTRADDAAGFSNYGVCNDLFAPGVDIESASYASDTGTLIADGTSMASPHVAGGAALVLEKIPSATPAQVWAAINADTTKGVISECCGEPDKLLHVPQAPTVAAPAAPSGLTGSVAPTPGVGSRQVRLSWSPPTSNGGSPITDYVIQRSVNGTNWLVVDDGVSTKTTITVGNLINGTSYRFRVAAQNATDLGPSSGTVAATPRWKPTAPTSLKVAVAPTPGVGSRQVRLSWSPPTSNGGSAISDYVIQRSVNGTNWSVVKDGVSTSRTAIVSGLTNGTSYRFRVAAKNPVGLGTWTTSARATPRAR